MSDVNFLYDVTPEGPKQLVLPAALTLIDVLLTNILKFQYPYLILGIAAKKARQTALRKAAHILLV